MHDGDQYFDANELSKAKNQAPDSRNKLIYVSPAAFLSVAMSGHNPDKEASVKAILGSGSVFNEVPFLNFVHDGEGTAVCTGHEGRHRAMILQENGVQQMPVLLQHRYDENGLAIVWDKIANDPESFQDEWPKKLYGERGTCPETSLNRHNFIPFPVPDPRLTEPGVEATEKAEQAAVRRMMP